MNENKEAAYLEQYRRDLFDIILPFWRDYGWDRKNGGIDTCLTREGKVFSAEKSVWMQGRGGWMMSHICKVFGVQDDYLAMAKSAIDFAREYCIDPRDGRMFFIVTREGLPVRKRRYDSSEKFYVMANAEYYGLTHDPAYLEEARKYHRLLVSIWKDPQNDPFKITPKFEPTAPAMRGLAGDEVLMLVTRTLRINDPEHREEYLQLERKLSQDIPRIYWHPRFETLLENVGPNGEYVGDYSSGRIVNPGHCMENAWSLLRASEELDDPSLVSVARKIYDGAMRWGWDEKYGGLLYFVDVEGYAPQAYEHDMKLWWVHTEAIIAALKLYRMTGDERYWNDFVMFSDYAFEHFLDTEYGEWYGYLRRDGEPTEPRAKGNIFKGPFHVPNMYSEVVQELEKLKK